MGVPSGGGRESPTGEAPWSRCARPRRDRGGPRGPGPLESPAWPVIAWPWAKTPLPGCQGRSTFRRDELRSGSAGLPLVSHREAWMAGRGSGRMRLVDDEALIRMGMRAILKDLGYEVIGEAA